MSDHRQLMKAKLGDLLGEKETLRKKAMATCRMIMPAIDPTLSEVVDMDIATAAAAMDELVVTQGKLVSVQGKITELEEALYG